MPPLCACVCSCHDQGIAPDGACVFTHLAASASHSVGPGASCNTLCYVCMCNFLIDLPHPCTDCGFVRASPLPSPHPCRLPAVCWLPWL
jgi:hypothetical protein